jgi:hypothetical protein
MTDLSYVCHHHNHNNMTVHSHPTTTSSSSFDGFNSWESIDNRNILVRVTDYISILQS